MANSQGQNDAINNANGVTIVSGTSGSSSVKTVVSGTAFQLSATRSGHLYLNITTSASLTISMGPTSSAADAIGVAQSEALGVTTLYVPAGWYVVLTGTVADFVATAVLN